MNEKATTEIDTLSIHDAMPICEAVFPDHRVFVSALETELTDHVFFASTSPLEFKADEVDIAPSPLGSIMLDNLLRYEGSISSDQRSEEHTSALQSQPYLVSRLLLATNQHPPYSPPPPPLPPRLVPVRLLYPLRAPPSSTYIAPFPMLRVVL